MSSTFSFGLFTFIIFVLIVLNSLPFQYGNCNEDLKVETTNGWIQGRRGKTPAGTSYSEFLGIPYAKPPVGSLRFKNPERPDNWTDVKSATRHCSNCLQQIPVIEIVIGNENCLCLNIYTPQIKPKKLLEVIFYIHGGAYMYFSGDKLTYGPELLLDQNVILITLNFRLGLIGYMTTEDTDIPGNFGLKDQTLALRWVRDNIAQFGGDPTSVTLMGESSGAASVHLHLLSPLSKGLYSKAIVQSASAWVPWAVAEPGVLRNRTERLAKKVGCPFTPSSTLLSCLQNVTAEILVATTKDFFVWDADPLTIWNPVVEPEEVEDAFITKSPRYSVSNVPLLIGWNFAEGALKTLRLTTGNVRQKFQQWNNDFYNLTAMSLMYENTAPDPVTVTKLIKQYYFGLADKITKQMIPQITQVYGDFWFTNGVLDAVEHHNGTTFLYYFNYNNSVHFSLLSTILLNPLFLGAAHSDELSYLFPMVRSYLLVNRDMSKKMVEMWIHFVKYSNPSITGVMWNPVSSPALEYLEISNNGMQMKTCPLGERRLFYKTLNLRNETQEESQSRSKSLLDWTLFCK